MSVYGSVAGSPCEVFVFPIGYVTSRAVVPEFLGESEINEEQFVAMATNTHEEIVRLDVSVNNEKSRMSQKIIVHHHNWETYVSSKYSWYQPN